MNFVPVVFTAAPGAQAGVPRGWHTLAQGHRDTGKSGKTCQCAHQRKTWMVLYLVIHVIRKIPKVVRKPLKPLTMSRFVLESQRLDVGATVRHAQTSTDTDHTGTLRISTQLYFGQQNKTEMKTA